MKCALHMLPALALAGLLASAANAASFATIYKYSGDTGENPTGRLLSDKSGALYGTVHFFGAGGGGAVFQLVPPAAGKTKWTENTLYSFVGGTDGDGPSSGLTWSKSGDLFGVTVVGGTNNAGTVYKLSPSGSTWTESVLYSFPSSDGYPYGNVLLDESGNLYGVTQTSIFRLTPPGGQGNWTASTLYTFSATGDGRGPTGGLIGDSSAVYGTTRAGGSSDMGTVFRLTPPESGEASWNEEILYSFSGADGNGPNGDLVAKGGALFGTTAYGGSDNDGTVFELKPPKPGKSAWRETVIHNFTGQPDGQLPYNGLTPGKNGSLYGTTVEGGIAGRHGWGTVFQLTPPAKGETEWTEIVLQSFDNKNGNSPGLLLLDKSGAIYGSAQYGSSHNTGTSFQILP